MKSQAKRAAGVFMVVFGFGALFNMAFAIWLATGYYDQNGHAAELLPLAIFITLFATQGFYEAWMFHKNVGNPNYSAKLQIAQFFVMLFAWLSALLIGYAAFANIGGKWNFIFWIFAALHAVEPYVLWRFVDAALDNELQQGKKWDVIREWERTKPNPLSPLPAHLVDAVAIDISSGKVYVQETLAADKDLLDWVVRNQVDRKLTLVPCQVEIVAVFPAR